MLVEVTYLAKIPSSPRSARILSLKGNPSPGWTTPGSKDTPVSDSFDCRPVCKKRFHQGLEGEGRNHQRRIRVVGFSCVTIQLKLEFRDILKSDPLTQSDHIAKDEHITRIKLIDGMSIMFPRVAE